MNEQLSLNEELFTADLKPYYWINQSNELINMTQDLTLMERRLVYSLIALIQPDDRDFKMYVIAIKDLADLLGIKGNSFYKRVENAVDGLMKKQIVRQSTDGTQVDKIQWVQKASYINTTGLVKIRLSEDLANYLIQLNSYTKYRLMNVLRLKSEYSWRIYELLKEDEWKSRSITYEKRSWKSYRIFKVDTLRDLLNIPPTKLKAMSNFRAKVLDVAKQELNEKTDLFIDYAVHKKVGRKIESFIFYINENPKNKKNVLDIESVTNDVQSIIHQLVKNGVRRNQAVAFMEKYHLNYVEANLRYVLNSEGIHQIDNIAGYICKAIEEGYANYEGPREREDEPLQAMLLKNVNERLKERTNHDQERIRKQLQVFENKLRYEPDYDLSLLKEERSQAMFRLFETIYEERRKQKYPPLLTDDFTHPTAKELFIQWKTTHEIMNK
ncbi:replication initiation protein [Peribacillus asahii]|uniref:replication initiation protein n=1 Tax=Peribacillus asahii TaxID=228899 RepID=UPI00207AAAA8|nr:replication initiation protein [Peribacillus asahii]USK62353.1 replication initiation protein [Peribacillus asahii]